MSVTVDETGIKSTSLAETIVEVRTRFLEAFGGNLALEPETPQGQIIAIEALGLTEVYEALVALGNASSVHTATGIFLEDLASLLGIERHQAFRSAAGVVLAGEAGTIIPGGLRVADSDGNAWLVPEETTIITAGITILLNAAVPGPTSLPAAGALRIITPIAGWDTATATGTGVLGTSAQSDTSLRRSVARLSARLALGPIAGIESALADAGATEATVVENATAAAVVNQKWPVAAHAVLVVADGPSDSNLNRAVENHRSQGVATITGIVGAARTTANIVSLRGLSNGSVTFGGVDYTGIDLTGASDADGIATILTSAITGVTFSFSYDQFIAAFSHSPDSTPAFDTGTVETLLGLDPDNAVPSPGAFVRPRQVNLTVALAITAESDYPADALARLRLLLMVTVDAYSVGQQVWANDLLAAAEALPGSRVTSLTVSRGTSTISGVAVPLDVKWRLPVANITITVTF